jgi:hypothetical protein
MTRGRRAYAGRHAYGHVAETQRLETEGVGMTGLITDQRW